MPKMRNLTAPFDSVSRHIEYRCHYATHDRISCP